MPADFSKATSGFQAAFQREINHKSAGSAAELTMPTHPQATFKSPNAATKMLPWIVTVFLFVLLTAHCLPQSAAEHPAMHWGSTWATPVHPMDLTLTRQTIRMTVRTAAGGDQVVIRLSNRFGSDALTIGEAHVAIDDHGPAILPGTDRTLTFSGRSSVTIPPGAYVISDPIAMQVPPVSRLAITVYVPHTIGMATGQGQGLRTTYISPTGNFAGATSMPVASTALAYYWLTEVFVARSAPTALLVAFGDSITNGYRSTVDGDASWPSVLGERLLHRPSGANISVINEGLGGNRILLPSHDESASNALARFDRDALDHPGVRAVIFLEGINDIGSNPDPDGKYVTADALEAAAQQLIARCHMRGIKIVGGTLLPYGGAPYFTVHGEETRKSFNQWIRQNPSFDAVMDFEQALRDPQHPDQMLPTYDSGDHLHPSDAGYAAMAQEAEEVLARARILSSR
jgi:lysophospholipase L1-like esterase